MNSRSEKYRKIDRQFLWHPYSSHSVIEKNDFPVITHGKGPYLFDCEGKRYFDAISSWWCCNLGHNHPRLVKAIKTQAGKLQHSILGNMSHPPAIALAEKIGNLFADNKRRVFFSSDGSSAVEAAIKIAVQYWHNIGKPKRCRLLSLENAYHGDTLGAVSAGFLPQFHRHFKPLTFPVYRATAPFCAHCPQAQKASCNLVCFQSMRKIIEKHGGEIAAVIVEPLCQCAAGMRMYPPSYLKKLAQLCRSHNILLIADEIAVGFGRLGSMFAFEQAGIDPDIVCLGKGLSGGYLPISATVVKKNIYASFSDLPPFATQTTPEASPRREATGGVVPKDNTFYHGHTFAGNPIACAAALEVLKIFREEKIVEQARRKGEMMRKKMAAFYFLKGVNNVRGLGMIAAFDLDNAAKTIVIKKAMHKAGVLIRPLGNTLYLMPPLITPDDLLVETINLLEKTLESI